MIYDTKKFWFKLSLIQNHCVLNLIKGMDLLKFMTGLDIYHYLVLKNMMLFTIKLDAL